MSMLELQARPTDERFGDWYRKHHGPLVGWCTRYLGDAAAAEDVAHETLLRAWEHRDRLDDADRIGPWLFRVARNLCVDHLRARGRTIPAEGLENEPDGRAGPEGPVVLAEEHRDVREAFRVLNPRYRRSLYLRDVRGLGYAQVAALLGVTEEAARQVVSRARRSMKDTLHSWGQVFGTAAAPVGFRPVVQRALGLVAQAPTGRPSLGTAIAALSLAAAATFGVATGPGDDATPPERSEGAATETTQVTDLPDVEAGLPELPDAGIDAPELPSAPAVETPGTPETPEPPDVRVGLPSERDLEVDLPDAGVVGRVTDALPPVDVELLERTLDR